MAASLRWRWCGELAASIGTKKTAAAMQAMKRQRLRINRQDLAGNASTNVIGKNTHIVVKVEETTAAVTSLTPFPGGLFALEPFVNQT